MEYPTGVLAQVGELMETNLVVTPSHPVPAPKSVRIKKAFSSSRGGPPGSTPPHIDRLVIDVQSGARAVSVLAMLDESSADLVILEDKCGFIELGLDKAASPEGERLVHQINWVIKVLENAKDEDNVKDIIDVLVNSIQLGFLNSYEVKNDESKVTLFMKKILPPLKFYGLFELTERSKLGGDGENEYIIKLELDKNTGKTLANQTQVEFSPRIKMLMPNFANNRIRFTRATVLSGEQFSNYLVQIEDIICEDLEEAREGWEQRTNFFASIYRQRYSNEKPEDIVIVKGEKMKVLGIRVRSELYEAVLIIRLQDNFPMSYPDYNLKITVEETLSHKIKINPRRIHKKEPFGNGWSIEGMALEIVEAIPKLIDYLFGKVTEEAVQNARINQPDGDELNQEEDSDSDGDEQEQIVVSDEY